MQSNDPQTRRTALAVFLLLLGFYLLTSGGHIYVKDGGAMFFMTRSIAEHGWFDVPVNPNTLGGKYGPDGHYYTPFGILQPLLAVPFYWLGKLLESWSGARYLPAMTITWFNAVCCAALAALIYRFLFSLGAGSARAVTAAIAFAVSTPFWVYSGTFFTEPLTALGILAGAWHIHRFGRTGELKEVIPAALWSAAVPLVRPLAGAALPVLFLMLLLTLSRASADLPSKRRTQAILIFSIAIAAGIGLLLAYNTIRFGHPLETGYDKLPDGRPRNFILPATTGLKILLLAPGKSIFIFMPLIIAGLAGLLRLRKNPDNLPELTFALVTPLLFIAILCRWVRVEGGVTWGPRLVTPALPPLILGIAPLLKSKSTFKLVITLAIAGIFVQLPAATTNFSTYIFHHTDEYFNPINGDYQFDFNPLPGQYRILLHTITHPHRIITPYSHYTARQHRDLIQINIDDPPDLWWVLAFRDRLPISFVLTLLICQAVLAITGLRLLLKKPVKRKPTP